jgi:4-amino-4-deoxy-L-arabinose transferase-like glycosyltransferase
MAADRTGAWWHTERPFLVALAGAALVRLVVAFAFPPAFVMSDAAEYLTVSDHISPSPDRPVGYSFFLRGLSEVTRSLLLVTSLQLVLGLATAVVAYALLRRWRVNPRVATLATVPMLFDAMQLLLEHAILSDVLFGFLVVTAVAALAWRPTPRLWTTAAAGLLLGLATLVRVLGEPTVVLAALFLLLVATTWRSRLAHMTLVIAAFAAPVAAYAGWYHHEHGAFAISQTSGRSLYMRTTTFVDCTKIQVPDYERVLCPAEPLGQRQDPTWYGWHSLDTVPRLHPPSGVSDEQAMRGFAISAIRAQPGAYARVVGRDFALAFVAVNRNDYFEMGTSIKWSFRKLVGYEDSRPWIRPTFLAHGGQPPVTHQPVADAMGIYGLIVFLPGPLALVLLVLAVAGIAVRRRDEPPSLRPLALLTLALPLTLIAVPDVTAEFVWRYQLPLATLLPLSAALGWTRLRARADGQPGTTPTPSTD